MTWKNIKLIFTREVRDQLRDRRTLFMVAVLPLLLYPALGIGMVQMTVNFSEQTRTVVLLGAKDLPPPPLVNPAQPDRFIAEYFATPEDSDKLRVLTEDFRVTAESSDKDKELAAFIRAASGQRKLIEDLGRVIRERREIQGRLARISDTSNAATKDAAATSAAAVSPASSRKILEQQVKDLTKQRDDLKHGIEAWFNASPVQVLIVVPEGFAKQLTDTDKNLADRNSEALKRDELPRPVILQNSADEKSHIAYRRIKDALREWEDLILQARLNTAGLPNSLTSPVDATEIDLAQKDQLAANLWSKLFPAMLVIMAVTGAFYPAIDLGAGEKERGTMETLLICPATRTEIVTGKFLTVMCFSLSTALLNLISMGFTGRHVLSVAGAGRLGPMGEIAFPPLLSLAWVLVLAVPLAALFSALSLALAMFAKSSKEGQYYLTPLLMGTMGLTMFCLNPGVEITPYYSIMPVMGPALLLKGLLLAGPNVAEYTPYILSVLLSSCCYCALALWWAIDLFNRETVLFREAERFDVGAWVQNLLRRKESTPTFGEAGFCFVVILLLQFASMTAMQQAILADAPGTTITDKSIRMLSLQAIYLLATVAAPALFMALMLTSSFRQTLKLYMPSLKYLAVGILLAFTLQPVSIELVENLKDFFPKPPSGAADLMKSMSDPGLNIWLPLLAFALAPAICEELAFRGFILSGLQRSGRTWLAITFSAVAFGIVHMIAQQVFNAVLMGLVLGLLAVRSRSLIPGVIFHFIYNGSQVLLSRVDVAEVKTGPLGWLFDVNKVGEQEVVRHSLSTLAIAGLASVLLVGWLLRQPQEPPRESAS